MSNTTTPVRSTITSEPVRSTIPATTEPPPKYHCWMKCSEDSCACCLVPAAIVFNDNSTDFDIHMRFNDTMSKEIAETKCVEANKLLTLMCAQGLKATIFISLPEGVTL